MIELLLEAESALSLGLLDRAEILYRQVAGADPRNSIAVVGLARVLLERGDEPGALKQARRALAIDAENTAAQRMVQRLEEVLEHRQREGPRADASRSREEASRSRPQPVVPDPTREARSPAEPGRDGTPAAGAPLTSEASSGATVPPTLPAAVGEPPQEAHTDTASPVPLSGPPPDSLQPTRDDRRPRTFIGRLLRRRHE